MSFDRATEDQLSFQFPQSREETSDQGISALPMQYLGGKARIASWILEHVRTSFPNGATFFDLFAGTGVVSLAAAMYGYCVFANDVQPYSYYILSSLLSNPRQGLPDLLSKVEKLNYVDVLLSGARNDSYELLQAEDKFLHKQDRWDWKDYKAFCEETPRILGTSEEANRLRTKNRWNLFSQYYPNTYFGIRQCLQIDAIRELADTLEENLRVHLLAATVSVMTYAVSSTTHLAQFLKPTNKIRVSNLLKKRSINIIEEVCLRLKALYKRPYFDRKGKVTNLDFRLALERTPIDSTWIIYVDPPYFKEHYSRYYHVLDTFILYDYPELTINPQTGNRTTGLYRKERFVSEFGLKSSVAKAFVDLFNYCRKKEASVAVSYANTSLLGIKHLINISQEQQFIARIETTSLMHSGQGQPRNRNVTEYLILLKPDEYRIG